MGGGLWCKRKEEGKSVTRKKERKVIGGRHGREGKAKEVRRQSV